MKFFSTIIAAVVSLFLLQHAHGSGTHRFDSGPEKVQLIELFTSEGCSSCPPADRWLSSLQADDGLWKQFIPLAFHVDYWDYIGWQDPYAKREYSNRQRRYAAEFAESTVYTPGVRRSGLEWRQWRQQTSSVAQTGESIGALALEVRPDNTFRAVFSPQDASRNVSSPSIQLSVALLGFGLRSEVTRGENHGKTLNHDFVVLTMATYAGSREEAVVEWSGVLPDNLSVDSLAPQKLGIAAWVTKGNSLLPLQAVGGMLGRQ